ncbi:MAG: MBOAT family protein, partial [Clostridia bacterium]|nr:MBOAT family protein [Clostridia bacterium]
MLFSSITFLYFFLPIVMGLYFAVPFRFKNLILLLASLFFYFAGEPIYSILMVASSLSGWLHGLWIGKWKGQAKAKIPLISSIVFGLAGLLFFKYTDFFLTNINGILGTSIGLLKLALPIG